MEWTPPWWKALSEDQLCELAALVPSLWIVGHCTSPALTEGSTDRLRFRQRDAEPGEYERRVGQ
ncbi:hypothetical protein [Streptomyces sp. NPDC098101]|uniref:hypothetical protein n=1 Tax=Streptomyces sp. NPDC098101 TaxID=3366096 RepID=UPI00382D2C6F